MIFFIFVPYELFTPLCRVLGRGMNLQTPIHALYAKGNGFDSQKPFVITLIMVIRMQPHEHYGSANVS